MEIVLNEKEWVEDMVAAHQLGDLPWLTIHRYAIYLRTLGYNNAKIKRTLEDYVLRCDPDCNRLQWEKTIETAVKNAGARNLIQVAGISISKHELEAISRIAGTTRQKVLFTLLCLAKFRDAIRENNNGWVSFEISEVFRLANVTLTKKRQMLIIHDLCEMGVIGYSRIIDSTNIRVKITDYESEEAMFITDFRNLGNQYMRLLSDQYMECEECGLVIKRTNNRQRYCRDCAEDVHRTMVLKKYRMTSA